MIFIEGQKKKNKEIDELKVEISNLRKDYDVEIKTMFLELNRVKDELGLVKYKTFGSEVDLVRDNMQGQNANQVGGGNNLILGNKVGCAILKKDERRYEPHSSSVGSFEFSAKAYQRER